MNNKICISIGDIKGIGIDILIKLYLKNKIKNFILFTNLNIFKNFLRKNNLKIKINLVNIKTNIKYDENKINLYNFKASNNIENSMISIKKAYQFCKENSAKGLLTLPVNKKIISKKYKNFCGHTEYLANLENNHNVNMIFIYNKLIISTLTTHIKLNEISKKIKEKNFILNKLLTLNKTLINDFKIKNPKIMLSGINPHAGEKGLIGYEEINFIIPTLKKLKKMKINIIGPISGDSMLLNKNIKKIDCFVFIYHDQALIPFKFISQSKGINYTSNLKIIRVSPDHGTGYDLVGKNQASNKSILNCIKFINKINKNKNIGKY